MGKGKNGGKHSKKHSKKADIIREGKLVVNERGFGFVEIGDEEKDVYVSLENMNGAIHKDVVRVSISDDGRESLKVEGRVVKILEQTISTFVGALEIHDNKCIVIPDDKRLGFFVEINDDDLNDAREGQKVLAEITDRNISIGSGDGSSSGRGDGSYSGRGDRSNIRSGRGDMSRGGGFGLDNKSYLQGRIIEVIGYTGDPGVDVLAIIKDHGFSTEFPDEVLKEADAISDFVDSQDMKGRKDLREQRLITIDGADSKDLDDAVSIEALDGGWYRLGVHIADVSAYVREGSALDKEARDRGTSLYFVDRVLPMLPQKLSNGICSLHPNADRLAISVILDIDDSGHIRDFDIFESVIKTAERMTYEDVYSILKKDDTQLRTRYTHIVKDVELMAELANKLWEKRLKRGTIDFSFSEAKILLDKSGKPLDIIVEKLTIANKIIEEFMIACNEAVAERMYWAGVPFIYRTHDKPDPEKILAFKIFAGNLGFTLKTKDGDVHPRELQAVALKAKDSRYEKVINTVMLRSMAKAKYTRANVGHFGLSSEHYCHFTAPIRRYPDLMVHRLIKLALNGRMNDDDFKNSYERILPGICLHCSDRERAADEAERETEDLKKAEYMKQFVGEKFEGVISNITSFGMFVELDNTVEGLIRLSDMYEDYYEFIGKQYCLIGEDTGKIYRIGDVIEVLLARVNIEARQIDFHLVYTKCPKWK